MFKKINFYQLTITIVAVILTSAAITYGWTAPVGGPPGNDTEPPINVGPTAQTKLGGLILGTGLSSGQTALSIPIGNVGIGIATSSAKLEVVGGSIKATGGLIIETRTSDPVSPTTGQIWLRTDL